MNTEKKDYTLEEVFTPSQPADVTFIDRKSLNTRLDRAIRTPGKQIVVFGYSGVGKSTLILNKLKEHNLKSIKTNCIASMTISDIIIGAFNQLDIYYSTEKSTTISKSIGGQLSANFLSIKAGIKAGTSDDVKIGMKRAVDLPISPQTLAQYIGEAGCCWIIEDFHKIEAEHKKPMVQIMKVFMDYSISYKNLKIIAIGAVNSGREVVQFDPEMQNRITEVEVPLMDIQSLKNIMLKGEDSLNIRFTDNVKNRIATYSYGLPAVTHQLSQILCDLKGVYSTQKTETVEINSSLFKDALNEYIDEKADTFKSIYEHATKIHHKRKDENPYDLLKAIISINKEEFLLSDIKSEIEKKTRNYKGTNLRKYIREFTEPMRSEILRYNENGGVYFFSNPFIKAYFQCVIEKNNLKTIDDVRKDNFIDSFKATLNKELIIARQAFLEDLDKDGFGDFDDF